jgi:hypothetical protein
VEALNGAKSPLDNTAFCVDGMPTTNAEQINADLLAFFKGAGAVVA